MSLQKMLNSLNKTNDFIENGKYSMTDSAWQICMDERCSEF